MSGEEWNLRLKYQRILGNNGGGGVQNLKAVWINFIFRLLKKGFNLGWKDPTV